jgi:hypothetical protein
VAFVEIDIEYVLPTWTTLTEGHLRGRRVIVLEQAPGTGAMLILPERGSWEPVHRLHLAAGRMWPEIQADERGQVWRGPGRVIAVPPGKWPV